MADEHLLPTRKLAKLCFSNSSPRQQTATNARGHFVGKARNVC